MNDNNKKKERITRETKWEDSTADMILEGGEGRNMLEVESKESVESAEPQMRRPQTHLVQPSKDMSGLMRDYTIDSELRSLDGEGKGT